MTGIWKPASGLASTIYPFAANGPFQLSLNVGDVLNITEENDSGWLKGELIPKKALLSEEEDNGDKRLRHGIFPRNYVQIKTAKKPSQASHEEKPVTRFGDPIVSELDVVLHEWAIMLKSFYQAKRYSEFKHLRNRMAILVDLRRELTAPNVSEVLRNSLKEEVKVNVEEGRRLMGLDLIPRRDNGDPADESNTGIVPLYRMHCEMDPFLTESAAADRKKAQKSGPSGGSVLLHLDFKACMCAVGEETEAYFSVYSKTEKKFLSEEFYVQLNSMGMPTDMDKIGDIKTLFEDLTLRDLPSDDTYLVCRMIRRGQLVYNISEINSGTMGSSSKAKASKNKVTNLRRRPFGVAVLNLTKDVMEQGAQKEHNLPIYYALQESGHSRVHELVIHGSVKEKKEIDLVPRSKGICVSVALLHGDAKTVKKEHPELMNTVVTPKRGFAEVIAVGTDRDDLYVQLVKGEFEKEMRKTSPKNIDVAMQVVLDSGQCIPNCISLGLEHVISEYHAPILYHMNDPTWYETVRLNVPAQHFGRAYLFFTFSHASSSDKADKAFAVSSMKLVDETKGTVVKNGMSNLQTFKAPAKLDTNEGIAAVLRKKDINGKPLQPRKEVFTLDTLLCSTRRVQNESLEALLKWMSRKADLTSVLNDFTYIDHIEIVKFLREIFDALFAVLAVNVDSSDYNNINSIPYLVYNALCYIVSLLVDDKTSRFTNFRPVLDSYVSKHFGEAKAYIALVRCLKMYLKGASDLRMAKHLRTSMRALEYIFRFIIASHSLATAGSKVEDKEFKKDILDVLGQVNDLMSATSPEWVIGAQTLAVKYFSSIFADLRKVYSIIELSQSVKLFIESIQESNKKQLNQEKLSLLFSVVSGDLFMHEEPRSILLPAVLAQVKRHIREPEERKQSINILAEMLRVIQDYSPTQGPAPYLQAILPMAMELLDLLLELEAAGNAEKEARAILSASILSLLSMADVTSFQKIVVKCNNTLSLSDYTDHVIHLLQGLRGILRVHCYPDNWLILHMHMRVVLIRSLSWILEIVHSDFTKDHFNAMIGNSFFGFCYDLAMDSFLQLEIFTEEKRKALIDKHSDLRVSAVALICELWEYLGEHQGVYVPDLVPDAIDLFKIPHDKIQKAIMDLYFAMICREAIDTGKFDQTERKTVSVMIDVDAEYIEGTYRGKFVGQLAEKFKENLKLKERGLAFVADINELLELVSALRTLQGPEHDDERTVVTLRLMSYLLSTDRIEAYIKYVGTLVDMHVVNQNFTEAGLTCLFHSDLCDWDDAKPMPSIGQYGEETMRERKIKTYREAIGLLDKGKSWEKAIELIRELREQYESVLFDYSSLAELLELEATLFRKIVDQDRFFAEYFRVSFWGKGFSRDYRSKEFVYRGQELERLSDFVQRIRDKFPDAELLQSNKTPGDEIVNGPRKYIQICTVQPCSEEEMTGQQPPQPDSRWPEAVIKYQANNNTRTFVFSRPFRRGDKSDNEFKTLWLLNTYLQTEDKFPTVKKRSLVVKRSELELSPIENALNSIRAKNKDLLTGIITNEGYTSSDNYTSQFTMSLNGVIDAAVNGGVYMYKDAFFSEAYLQNNPEHGELVKGLKDELTQQLNILERGLKAHAVVVPEAMQALHDHMKEFFAKMKGELEPALS